MPYRGRAGQRMATLPSHKVHGHALHCIACTPPVLLDLDTRAVLADCREHGLLYPARRSPLEVPIQS